jgi:alpha-glucuronidase
MCVLHTPLHGVLPTSHTTLFSRRGEVVAFVLSFKIHFKSLSNAQRVMRYNRVSQVLGTLPVVYENSNVKKISTIMDFLDETSDLDSSFFLREAVAIVMSTDI